MATSLELVGLLVILLLNTAVAALATRFFRVRLHTRWGSAIYTALLVPVLLFVIVLVLAGGLKMGPDLGSSAMVVGVTILFPMAVGVSFDYFWMPSPEEVNLPDQYRERDREPRRSQ